MSIEVELMRIYFNLNDGYLDGVSSSSDGYEHYAKVNPDHEVLRNPEIFKYKDGKLVKDAERQKELKEESEESKLSDADMNEQALMELANIVSQMQGGE